MITGIFRALGLIRRGGTDYSDPAAFPRFGGDAKDPPAYSRSATSVDGRLSSPAWLPEPGEGWTRWSDHPPPSNIEAVEIGRLDGALPFVATPIHFHPFGDKTYWRPRPRVRGPTRWLWIALPKYRLLKANEAIKHGAGLRDIKQRRPPGWWG